MPKTRFLAIALLSMTLIALELVWTRIFSAEFFYTFAFLILSIAIMGLGLGGLAVRLFPSLRRPFIPGSSLALAGFLALVGPPIVFRLGLNFTALVQSWLMGVKLLAAVLLLGSSFFFGGVALASLFKIHHQEISRLYMADLVGAAVGVILAIVLMNTVGTPLALFWITLPILLAAFLLSRSRLKSIPLILPAAVVLLAGRAETLLEARHDEPAAVIYKHWDAMAKIKAYDYEGEFRRINVDNVSNTPVLKFDGDWEALAQEYPEGLPWDIDIGYLIHQFEECTFLSLGCGGGWDVLQALEKGATTIHAVEVNRHLVKMMHDGDPDGYLSRDSTIVDSTGRLITMDRFCGGIFRDPRVIHVAEDARTYVRRHPNTFDVIFSLSSNTWAALGSGSFALAENYLFTTEAFCDYWHALTEDGFLSMEHQVYMPRLVSEALDALESMGVESPSDHIAVYNFPRLRRNVLLLSKRPLTDEIRTNAYGELTDEIFETRHLLYPSPDSLADQRIGRIVKNGWQAEADSAAVNITPCSDDRPFVAQMGLWKNLDWDRFQKQGQWSEFFGFPLSKLTLAILLALACCLWIPLTLLPYLSGTEKLQGSAWFYFFLIGLAFMSVEIVLIQRYTLFIGASIYSIATILLTLLLAAGTGSRFSPRIGDRVAFAGIVVWLLLEILLFPSITRRLVQLDILPRALIGAVLVAPLGFFMGMPFPKGTLRIRDRIDWGFAVNGAASVLGGVLVLLVAMTYGFTVALLGATLTYLVAYFLLSRRSAW